MNYIKMSPIAGMSGYGGGATALPFSGAALDAWYGDRGLFYGGDDNTGHGDKEQIDYISISTTGNASDFGDMTQGSEWYGEGAFSNTVRGVTGEGSSGALQYITFASAGNSTDFGDNDGTWFGGAASSGKSIDRGIQGGGRYSGNEMNTIQYITISTTGNTTDFGDLTYTGKYLSGCNDSTRCLFQGGHVGSQNTINYVEAATTSDATDFGDSDFNHKLGGATSDHTRGVIIGGTSTGAIENMCYVTIQSPGNATDFGDLIDSRTYTTAACTNGTRCQVGGGFISNASIVGIQYFTIQTTGNATDGGDLAKAKYWSQSSSGDA